MATGSKFYSLLLLIAFSVAVYGMTLQEFVSPYLYPGENYSTDVQATQVEAQGERFVLVEVRGADAFFLRRSVTSENETVYLFVNDTNKIYSVLREHYNTTSYPNATELDGIAQLIRSFNASRFPREEECKVSIGLDRPGATCPPQRCESCMSVPFCADKMPYFGNDFPQAIHNFEVDSKGIDAGLSGAINAIEALKQGRADAAEYLSFISSNLSSIRSHATSMQSNHLFGCYAVRGGQLPPIGLEWCSYREGAKTESQWCKDVEYNFTSLAEASTRTDALVRRVPTNQSLSTRAQALYTSMNARATALQLRIENETFQAFYAKVAERAGNTTQKANRVLAKIRDEQLQRDVSLISELQLRISQYGLDRNYSAANATAAQLYVLAEKIDAETENLSAVYSNLSEINDSASLALLKARLYIEPQDKALFVRLSSYESGKRAIDEVLSSGEPIPLAAVEEFADDLAIIKSKADSLTQEKQQQRFVQAGSWIADAARWISGVVIDGVSAVFPLSPETKESYAKLLPTAIVFLAGLLFYLACITLFAALVYTKRIYLHRIAVFLWAVIFAFLFVFISFGVISANTVIQQQASRSTFGLFSNALAASNSVSIVINSESNGASIDAMRSCADALESNLTALNKTVQRYEIADDNCTRADGAVVPTSECVKEFGENPVFEFHYANETNATFYVYYLQKALIYGNETFYSPCLIARVFNNHA